MKLTLIKEEIQDKNIVDEVMETHLYEDEQEKKAKEEEGNEVVNDEVVNDEQPESDAVQDILDPEETTGFEETTGAEQQVRRRRRSHPVRDRAVHSTNRTLTRGGGETAGNGRFYGLSKKSGTTGR